MLLVHPVLELVKFLPVLIGIFVLGSNGDQGWWQLFGVAIPIALGIMRFLTTTVPDHADPDRAPARADRPQGADRPARPGARRRAHLDPDPPASSGLAKVEVGTASGAKQDDDKFALDSLPLAEARQLRVALLHRVDVDGGHSVIRIVASRPRFG